MAALPTTADASRLRDWLIANLRLEQFAEQYDLEEVDSVRSYLLSPEVVTLIEHMFAFTLTGRDLTDSSPLMRELSGGLTLHLGHGRGSPGLQISLFALIRNAVSFTVELGKLTDRPLSAKAVETATETATEAYLRSIDAQIATLCNIPRFSQTSLDNTLQRYMRALLSVHGEIQPPSFEGAPQVPLESIFVAPNLVINYDKESPRRIDIQELITGTRRAVVLGDPGGGKSTLSSKIACDMVLARYGAKRGGSALVPVLVVLRDFGSYHKSNPCSIAEYLELLFRSKYQVDIDMTAIEWLLATGRLYLIFDGLDELLDPSYRRVIANMLQALAAVEPSTSILVTSRRVGYMQAPISTLAFETIQLGGLPGEKVAEYVRKWFSIDRRLDEQSRAKFTQDFLRDSELVSDLRTNPLMLALMCTIYKTESYIPRNRPDVYEKCSRMLFDRWDRHRGLLEPLEFEAHVEPALMYLAHWIYNDESLQSGVTEQALIARAGEYLLAWQYEQRSEADLAARQFIEFCKGRAWVFTDVGITPNGESLYQFTHRTFLEYFAAAHLARTHDIAGLVAELFPYILEADRDVTAQLAIQIKTKPMEGGADFVLTDLVRRSAEIADVKPRTNVMSFVSRSLGFMVPSPVTTRQLVNALVTEFLRVARNEPGLWSSRSADRISPYHGLISPLFTAAREVRARALNACAETILARCREDDQGYREFAAVLGWHAFAPPRGSIEAEPIRENMYRDLSALLKANVGAWSWAPHALLYTGTMSARQLCEIVNSDFLFRSPEIPGMTSTYAMPAAIACRIVLERACRHGLVGVGIDGLCEILVKAAEAIELNHPIQFEYAWEEHNLVVDRREPDRHRKLSEEETYAGCVVLAAVLEANESLGSKRPPIGRNSHLRPLAPLIRLRYSGTHKGEDAQAGSAVDHDILARWARRTLSLARQSGSR